MDQQNQILGIPQDVLDVFDQADQRCGFADVLQQVTYPPYGKIEISGDPEGENFRLKRRQRNFSEDGCVPDPNTPALLNSSISNCNGGCATATTSEAYLTSRDRCFSVYSIAYNCTNA